MTIAALETPLLTILYNSDEISHQCLFMTLAALTQDLQSNSDEWVKIPVETTYDTMLGGCLYRSCLCNWCNFQRLMFLHILETHISANAVLLGSYQPTANSSSSNYSEELKGGSPFSPDCECLWLKSSGSKGESNWLKWLDPNATLKVLASMY